MSFVDKLREMRQENEINGVNSPTIVHCKFSRSLLLAWKKEYGTQVLCLSLCFDTAHAQRKVHMHSFETELVRMNLYRFNSHTSKYMI